MTYEYYTDVYGGNLVPSESFTRFERQAENYVNSCLSTYTIYNDAEYIAANKDLCICEIMDSIFEYQNTIGRGISEEKDGSSSIKYSLSGSKLFNPTQQIMNIFASYFDYFRGGFCVEPTNNNNI